MRAPGRVIVFDCGLLGYLSIAAHGHADALHLSVSVDGRPILIDPGTYAYHEGGKWRDFFRSTAAHNTIVVDGCDQSEMVGAFMWGHKANVRLLRWESTSDYDLAIAEHDGYSNLGVIHQRSVLFVKPDWCLVADLLRGRGEHRVAQLWHLPANGKVEINCTGAMLSVGNTHLRMIPSDILGARAEVRYGEESPIQGWFSPHYGRREPAPVLCFSGRTQLPARWVTALHFAPFSTDSSLAVEELIHLLENLEAQ